MAKFLILRFRFLHREFWQPPPSPFPQLAMYMPAPEGAPGMYIASWGKGERGE